ncbi:MAG: hypothetical protein WC223_13835 [Bacteroidales bacterium]
MNIETKKVDLISWIANIRNPKLIHKLENFKNVEDSWWDDLPKKIQEEIIESEMQVNNCKMIPHEEVMKKFRKYL